MQRTTLYHLSMETTGLSRGLVGVRTIRSDGIALGAVVLVIGVSGILLSTLFALSRQRSSEFEPRDFVWIAVVAAIFSLLGMTPVFVQ